MKKEATHIFVDGSSRGNPGPGGWGVVFVGANGKIKELGGYAKETTNNRMELTGAIEALQYIEENVAPREEVIIYTDSAYALLGITGWVFAWEKNGWKTKTGKAVENRDLWEVLAKNVFRVGHKVHLHWEKVEGHRGIFGNERADLIATAYADGKPPLLFSGSEENYLKLYGDTFRSIETTKAKRTKKREEKAYSYVSLVGGVIRTDKTWEACEERVRGKSGAKFQKVYSREEEHELINNWITKA